MTDNDIALSIERDTMQRTIGVSVKLVLAYEDYENGLSLKQTAVKWDITEKQLLAYYEQWTINGNEDNTQYDINAQ